MTDGRRDTQLGAKKCGAQLRDKFLARVGLAAKATGEVPVEARDMSRPVTIMPISA